MTFDKVLNTSLKPILWSMCGQQSSPFEASDRLRTRCHMPCKVYACVLSLAKNNNLFKDFFLEMWTSSETLKQLFMMRCAI